MITKEEAIAALEEKLKEWGRYLEGGLIILPEYTVDLPYGWMFLYTSKRWTETRDIRHKIAGNGPVVILRETGELCVLGTSLGRHEALAQFEQARGLRSR